MSSSNLHVAIVGATGAVGIELMKVLTRRHFPVGKLTLLASARSAGKTLEFQGAADPGAGAAGGLLCGRRCRALQRGRLHFPKIRAARRAGRGRRDR